MLLTRPRRKLLFGTIATALVLAVMLAVLLPRSQLRYGSYLGGWPVMVEGEQSSFSLGLTQWLVIEQRQTPAGAGRLSPVQRRYHVNAIGLIEALAVVAIAVAGCVWAHRRLVGRFSLLRYCDECGYSVVGRTSTRCPECGAEGRNRNRSYSARG